MGHFNSLKQVTTMHEVLKTNMCALLIKEAVNFNFGIIFKKGLFNFFSSTRISMLIPNLKSVSVGRS